MVSYNLEKAVLLNQGVQEGHCENNDSEVPKDKNAPTV